MLLKFLKVGKNKWIPNIDCAEIGELALDPKIEKFFNRINKFNDDVLYVHIIEQGDIIIKEGLLQFLDESILRFMTTNDDFMMKMYINDHEFEISSTLFLRLEQYGDFRFCENTYRIEINNYEV